MQIQAEIIKAFAGWRKEKTLDFLQEECAELIVAISHYKRGRTDAAPVIEEMVDVALMSSAVGCFLSTSEAEYHKQLLEKIQKLDDKLHDART